MFFLPPTLHLGKTKENSTPKKRKGKFVGGTIGNVSKAALDKATHAANLKKLYASGDTSPTPEQRERILARNRKRATTEKNLDRAMEDEGKKVSSRLSKDELLKHIGKLSLDNWKKGTGTEELPSKIGNRFRKRKDYPPEPTIGVNIKSGGKIKKKGGGSVKKKRAKTVKSKYTTGNKRYSNGGKIYPR